MHRRSDRKRAPQNGDDGSHRERSAAGDGSNGAFEAFEASEAPEAPDREAFVRAYGHENVTARHTSTLEVTAEEHLTPAGDCIVGIGADRTPATVPEAFREACRDPEATITLVLEADAGRKRDVTDDGTGAIKGERTHTETIVGRGDPDLTFASERSMVVRTSEYVDDRTVMLEADKAAADLDRTLVDALAAGAELRAVLRVE